MLMFWWEKDGQPLLASSRRFFKTRLRSEKLRIAGAKAIDSGTYKCMARVNGRKHTSKTVEIRVSGKSNVLY